MIARAIAEHIRHLAGIYPVVSVSGPRQSGKTTLVRSLFAGLDYVNLEDPEIRDLANRDPRQFLLRYPGALVIDEVQYAPTLFSYIQLEADRRQRPGQFILTGSQNFLLLEKITQSLAGRVALFHLLPLSVAEVQAAGMEADSLTATLFRGMYPRLFETGLDPGLYYPNYLQTYVERDVRQLVNVGDLSRFRTFLELCAGRIGQLYNQSTLAAEMGMDHKTAARWFSLLETSFIAFTLRPYHRNFNKRVLKTAKVYFYDTGLACALLGIRKPEHLDNHPLRGPLFENFVVVEIMKTFLNRGLRPNLYFWRNRTGHEIDLLLDEGGRMIPMEIKSSMTLHPDHWKGLRYFNELTGNDPALSWLIYGGRERMDSAKGNLRPWFDPPAL